MEPVLAGSKCKGCGKIFFPKKRVCSNCLSMNNMEAINLSTKGKLFSYTINHVGSPGFNSPYVFGYIQLPEDIWIYSVLLLSEPFEKLKVGMEVQLAEVEARKDEFGREHLTWRFKLL